MLTLAPDVEVLIIRIVVHLPIEELDSSADAELQRLGEEAHHRCDAYLNGELESLSG